MGKIVDQCQSFVSDQMRSIATGTEAGVDLLTTMLKNGAFAGGSRMDLESSQMNDILKNIIFGQLILQAWGMSYEVTPVIVMQDPATDENPFEGVFNDDSDKRHDTGGANNWGLKDTDKETYRVTIDNSKSLLFLIRGEGLE